MEKFLNAITNEFYEIIRKHYSNGARDLCNAERVFEDFRRAFSHFFGETLFNIVCKEYVDYIKKVEKR
jgi:hypothetical protein